MLEIVGLRDRARDRVKAYSLGMKQRLAVASALLKSPTLLILDEPANGLDPGGIREMRDLMRNLVANDCTVVLSSHILGEVQQICDSVTIISRGRRVAAGPVDEVLKSQDKGEYRLRAADLAGAARLLAETGAQVQAHPDHLVISGLTDPAGLNRFLGLRDVWISELTPIGPDLESVFLDLTGTMPAPGQNRQVDQRSRNRAIPSRQYHAHKCRLLALFLAVIRKHRLIPRHKAAHQNHDPHHRPGSRLRRSDPLAHTPWPIRSASDIHPGTVRTTWPRKLPATVYPGNC